MRVCFIGHRTIENIEQIRKQITETVYQLIQSHANTFLFGSKSQFDSLCWEIITEFQKQYKTIKRIYVRATYPTIQKYYEDYLLKCYEETYFPKGMENAGRCSYIKRNQKMIDASDVCVFYYDSEYKLPPKRQKSYSALPNRERKSGTALAFAYATQKNKKIINLYQGKNRDS